MTQIFNLWISKAFFQTLQCIKNPKKLWKIFKIFLKSPVQRNNVDNSSWLGGLLGKDDTADLDVFGVDHFGY